MRFYIIIFVLFICYVDTSWYILTGLENTETKRLPSANSEFSFCCETNSSATHNWLQRKTRQTQWKAIPMKYINKIDLSTNIESIKYSKEITWQISIVLRLHVLLFYFWLCTSIFFFMDSPLPFWHIDSYYLPYTDHNVVCLYTD